MKRTDLIRITSNAACDAGLSVSDRTKLLNMARTANVVAAGIFNLFDRESGEAVGCPLSQIGVWNDLTGYPEGTTDEQAVAYDKFYAEFDRLSADYRDDILGIGNGEYWTPKRLTVTA